MPAIIATIVFLAALGMIITAGMIAYNGEKNNGVSNKSKKNDQVAKARGKGDRARPKRRNQGRAGRKVARHQRYRRTG